MSGDMRSVVDDLGATVAVPERPTRFVSLVPSLSEVLWWWQLADDVVAVTDWCVAPPSAFPTARRVRGTKNPDVRAIVELAPDVVVANEEENRELDVRRLREAGVAVYVTRVRTVDDAAGALARLGAALGVERAGAGSAQAIRRALDQLPRPRRRLRAFCPVWRDGVPSDGGPLDETWWALGRDTFGGDLLARCGFDVVPDAADGRYPRLRLQEVADAAPEVVLLPDEPYLFGEQDRAVFADWSARTRLLDGTALSWWGPRTPHALGDLARLARQLDRRRQRASSAVANRSRRTSSSDTGV
ncbi:helical backbone metal receptor [Egicoccus halophilus]|uniref:ABC transporter substrate-binding protein n=1 Tax=Egicoccus halophilus TaxID=1670830 RepID=A0A8J3AGB6_9ACTN|nr:helical backbone metal receptor [Egicoccus halophilus]GGI08214.1 ABC transporter substrate-binding protein [Egicoccus halophilus]